MIMSDKLIGLQNILINHELFRVKGSEKNKEP
jgi:hypothetical protein